MQTSENIMPNVGGQTQNMFVIDEKHSFSDESQPKQQKPQPKRHKMRRVSTSAMPNSLYEVNDEFSKMQQDFLQHQILDPVDLRHSMAAAHNNQSIQENLLLSGNESILPEDVMSKRRSPFYMRTMKHSFHPKSSFQTAKIMPEGNSRKVSIKDPKMRLKSMKLKILI